MITYNTARREFYLHIKAMDVIVVQNYLLATMATLLLFHLFFFGKICLGQKIVFHNIDEKRKHIIVSV